MSGEKRKVGKPKKSPRVVLDQKDGDVKTFYSQQDLKAWMDAQDALVHTTTGKHPEDQTNPDCEPATKGFVKCIARKTFKAIPCIDRCSVKVKDWTGDTAPVAILSAMMFIGWGFAMISNQTAAVWALGVGSIALATVWLSLPDKPTVVITCDDPCGLPSEIKKCKPTCEKKKDCE